MLDMQSFASSVMTGMSTTWKPRHSRGSRGINFGSLLKRTFVMQSTPEGAAVMKTALMKTALRKDVLEEMHPPHATQSRIQTCSSDIVECSPRNPLQRKPVQHS